MSEELYSAVPKQSEAHKASGGGTSASIEERLTRIEETVSATADLVNRLIEKEESRDAD